jgi:hypothetical protein
MSTIPTVVTIDGLQPQSPTALQSQLIAAVTAEVPGYTADLPSSMIEDISSTDVAAIALCDQARVELVNSLTPYGANQFILNQLGVQAGIPPNTVTNTAVYLAFAGTPGYVVDQGFIASDGSNQYVLQDTVIVPTSGTSSPAYCVSTTPGSFAVPEDTVTIPVTSIPTGVTLTFTNPNAGIPGQPAESVDSYRSRVIQAQASVAQGMTTTLRTALQAVPGVQANLISIIQQTGGGWSVICGGGDQYEVANAIFLGLFDISTLVGSALAITGMTNANPVVITTNLNHNYLPGETFAVAGATPSAFNTTYTVASVTPTTITTTTNGSAFGAYVSGASLNPNPRNETVTIQDYPNTYTVVSINPPQQIVTIEITWNTNTTNIVSNNAVAQAMVPAVVSYINGITVGQPMNTFEIDNTIQAAVVNLIPTEYLTRLVYSIAINGITVTPETGTGIVAGDPESYFYITSTGVTVVRG